MNRLAAVIVFSVECGMCIFSWPVKDQVLWVGLTLGLALLAIPAIPINFKGLVVHKED